MPTFRQPILLKPEFPLGNALADAVHHGVSTINLIDGLMMVFIILLTMLDHEGITSTFNHAAEMILHRDQKRLFHGLWEITIVTKELGGSATFPLQLPLTSAILAFGGVSTAIQAQAQINGADITLRRYLPYKLAQSIIAFLLSLFLPTGKQAVAISEQITTVVPPDSFNYLYPKWSAAIWGLMGASIILLRIQARRKQRVFVR